MNQSQTVSIVYNTSTKTRSGNRPEIFVAPFFSGDERQVGVQVRGGPFTTSLLRFSLNNLLSQSKLRPEGNRT